MGKYIAENLVKCLIKADKPVKNARVAILGFTFKENCPDTRNTKVMDIVNELREYDIHPVIFDPVADKAEAKREYGVDFGAFGSVRQMDAVVLAVAHDELKSLSVNDMDPLYKEGKKVLIDVKGICNREEYETSGYVYWSL